MKALIEVINKLQDVFQTVDNSIIQLPQIAVVGTQSAGKSSVIESIVGRSFLPRGTGIVTRRPLVLQLLRCPLDDTKHRLTERGTKSIEEWGEFLHKEGEIFTDFDSIRKEIELDTDRIAGDNKGICDEPINLRIFSSRVVDLTLVDLPGMTKVPVGDQPKDIESQIKNLIFKYIENVNCIILAVTAANGDIATSEALKFAKEVDPDGARTLAVLTKLDLMDEGTDAIDMLNGNVLPVKLGIIGVINRSQKDINENKNIDQQLQKEAEFFKKNYSMYAQRSGTPYLAKTLSNLLILHIRDHLPDLKKRVNHQISENQNLLTLYGDEVVNKEYTLIRIITKFSNAYRTTTSGTTRNCESEENTRLYNIIHEKFEKALDDIQPKVEQKEASAWLFKHSAGPRPNLFDIPSFDIPFESLIKLHIKKLKEPSLELINSVHKEIKRNVEHCTPQLNIEWKRFPNLKRKILNVVKDMVFARVQVAREMIENIIESEMAYINKKHPDFHKEKALGPLVDFKRVQYQNGYHTVDVKELTGCLLSGTKGDKENCEVLAKLVELYFGVVRKNVQDAVPKVIMLTIVNFIADNIESELHSHVCKAEQTELLLDESNDISKKREKARSNLMAFKRANLIINEVYEGDDEIN